MDGVEKKSAPVISVIMGVYNGERFLGEAIESILTQTFGDFEFIVCNDCSTDGSLEILHRYAKQDNRIVILENTSNLGLAATLNMCLQMAKGQWIARMDCDDRALPDRFAYQLQWLQEHPNVSAVGTAVEFINDHGQVFARMDRAEDTFFQLEDAVRYSVLVHPSVMMRKEDVLAAGGYSVNSLTTRAEDYDLWCKLCEKGTVVANMSTVLFQYREDERNVAKRKYKYRIQEAKLKWRWMRRAKCPKSQLIYAIKPLLVGLIPLSLYKKLHQSRLAERA